VLNIQTESPGRIAYFATRLRFYVHSVRLVDGIGRAIPLQLGRDGKRQSDERRTARHRKRNRGSQQWCAGHRRTGERYGSGWTLAPPCDNLPHCEAAGAAGNVEHWPCRCAGSSGIDPFIKEYLVPSDAVAVLQFMYPLAAGTHFGSQTNLGASGLGILDVMDDGVPRDDVGSPSLVSSGGDLEGMNNVGSVHSRGHGVVRGPIRALELCRKAPESGDAVAQNNPTLTPAQVARARKRGCKAGARRRQIVRPCKLHGGLHTRSRCSHTAWSTKLR
jgi:hypothetical protein